MKPARAALRQLGFLAVRQSLRLIGIRPPRVLFIMGHMRSGSTLLMHLLVNHPQIIGCGERSVAYRSDDDLDKLELAARRSQHSLFRQVSYVVDQLNHDQFTPERGFAPVGTRSLHFLNPGTGRDYPKPAPPHQIVSRSVDRGAGR